MQDLFTSPAIIASGAAGMLVFAIIRRLMRAEHPPRFLASDVSAYAVALLLTAFFALSMMATAWAIMPYVGSTVNAAVSSMLLHLVYWIIARLIVPVRATDGDTTVLPPAAPAV